MVQNWDVQEMQQCIIIHCVSSPVMMAIWGLGLNQGDVSRMELGVDNTSLVKVCTAFFNKDLSSDYSCGLLEVDSEEVVTCSRSKISKQEKKIYFEWFPNRCSLPALYV